MGREDLVSGPLARRSSGLASVTGGDVLLWWRRVAQGPEHGLWRGSRLTGPSPAGTGTATSRFLPPDRLDPLWPAHHSGGRSPAVLREGGEMRAGRAHDRVQERRGGSRQSGSGGEAPAPPLDGRGIIFPVKPVSLAEPSEPPLLPSCGGSPMPERPSVTASGQDCGRCPRPTTPRSSTSGPSAACAMWSTTAATAGQCPVPSPLPGVGSSWMVPAGRIWPGLAPGHLGDLREPTTLAPVGSYPI